MKRFLAVTLTLIPLAGCSLFSSVTPVQEEEIAVPMPETKNVIYRGTLLPIGASIYMEGTHRLELEDGRFVLLESNGLILDEYLMKQVEVFGATRPTVEGGGIVMRVERIADFVESSSSTSSIPSESSSSEASSSVQSSSLPVIVSSTTPAVSSKEIVTPPSSAPIVPPISSAAPVQAASASSAPDAVSLRAATMAKVSMSSINWTQEYCSTHIQFCFPIHKNWWYTSFGATTNTLWHVELSSEELQAIGDGPIMVSLLSETIPGPDGQVTNEGGFTTGLRAWTNGRHFVIRAPIALEAAVRYITQELKALPVSPDNAQ